MSQVKQSILIVSVAFSILLLAGNAAALGLEYYGVEDTINDDLSVTSEVVLKFDSPVNSLDYTMDYRVEDLEYESDFDFAECRVRDSNGGSTISCTFIGMTPERNKLTLSFTTRDVIQKLDGNYRFTVNHGISLPIQSSFILIRLPQNNILAGERNESYFPVTGDILTDGRHIMVFWEDESLETGENLQFSILFTRPPFGTEFLTFFLYALFIVAIAVMVLVAIYVKRIRGTKVAAVKSVLNRDEKRIIDILNQKGGKAGQKLLVRETDFSKAKVSRLVKNLRERGVVGTEPISGRENRVILRLGEGARKGETE
jgi:uncharacterized membrane protein